MTTAAWRVAMVALAMAAANIPSAVAESRTVANCPADTDAAASDATTCEGVRPGALLMPMGCTAGFMFKGGGHYYVSTAGHCAGLNAPEDGLLFPAGEERVWQPGQGDAVYDRGGARIGEFAYAIRTIDDPNPSPLPRDADFALIRLDRGVAWSAQMCHFGGPTGLNLDRPPVSDIVTVQYFGNTFAGGYDFVREEWVLPARTAVALGMPDEHKVMANGHASFGDSGAPVTTEDGRAVGLLAGPPDDVPDDGHAGGFVVTRLAPQSARAAGALEHKLRLVTAQPLP